MSERMTYKDNLGFLRIKEGIQTIDLIKRLYEYENADERQNSEDKGQ